MASPRAQECLELGHSPSRMWWPRPVCEGRGRRFWAVLWVVWGARLIREKR